MYINIVHCLRFSFTLSVKKMAKRKDRKYYRMTDYAQT